MKDPLFDDVLDYGLNAKIQSSNSFLKKILIGIGVLIGLGLSLYFYIEAVSPPYIDLSFAFLTSVALSACLYGLFILLQSKKLIFKENEIIISTYPFGKKVIKKVNGYGYKSRKEDDEENREDLIAICFADGYEVIGSNMNSQFSEVKKFLEANYTDIGVEAAFKKHRDRTFRISMRFSFFFMGLLLLSSFIIEDSTRKKYLSGEIIKLELSLSKNPEPIEDKDKDEKEGFILSTTEYPSFKFFIKKASFHASIAKTYNPLKRGDEVLVGINKHVYESKLSGEQKPDFLFKHFDWFCIDVLHLEHQGLTIIEFDTVKRILRNKNGTFLLFLGSILLLIWFVDVLIQVLKIFLKDSPRP